MEPLPERKVELRHLTPCSGSSQHHVTEGRFNRAVQMTVGGVAGWYRQTLDGSFSSVSRPIFASKYSFFSIFRDLQDLYSPVGEKKTTEFVFPQKESFGKSKVVWVDFVFKIGAKICWVGFCVQSRRQNRFVTILNPYMGRGGGYSHLFLRRPMLRPMLRPTLRPMVRPMLYPCESLCPSIRFFRKF